MFEHKGYTEKALSRMIKAKAKADRAAARLAAAGASNLAPAAAATQATANVTAEDSPAPEPAPETQTQAEAEDVPAVVVAKEAAPDRTELLRSHPEVVGRYMHLMVPILVDVYAASVITPVRVKTLTGLLKAVSFLDADELRRVFTVRFSSLYEIVLVFIFSVVRPRRELRILYPLR